MMWALRLLGCIRYREVLILQGTPIMGMILAPKLPLGIPLTTYVLFGLANFCLVAHIWMLNDWADAELDATDQNKQADSFVRKGVCCSSIGWFTVGLLLASLGLFACFEARTFWIAVGIAILGFVYSFPGIRGKGIVLISSLLHLAGGTLHLLLGYTLFSPLDHRALLLGTFFALIFTAGHCIQEVQDQDADRLSGVQTNSVVFGKLPVFCMGTLLFLWAYLQLLFLNWTGVLSIRFPVGIAAIAGLHLVLAYQTVRSGLSFDDVHRFRQRYRAVIVFAGFLLIL